MIYTITLNPSLDYMVSVDNYSSGGVNRTSNEQILPGGKGINVSIVLQNLEADTVALGFIGGFTGDKIVDLLNQSNVNSNFVRLKNGDSRINVKIKSTIETEINAKGPCISAAELNEFFCLLDNINDGDYVVISGSVPDCLPPNVYEVIAKKLSDKDVNIVVDAEKKLLLPVLAYSPFLIKPNHHELGDIFDCELNESDEIIEKARCLQSMGAKNVLVSIAGNGAILITEDGNTYKKCAPKGKVINSVGAGDSMVAGFISKYIETNDYEKAFDFSLATGSASAFSSNLATKKQACELLHKIK